MQAVGKFGGPVHLEILLQNLNRVCHLTLRELSLWLNRVPKFQVLQAVVCPVAILMVDILPRQERSTQMLLHEEAVLELMLIHTIENSSPSNVSAACCPPRTPLARRIGPT